MRVVNLKLPFRTVSVTHAWAKANTGKLNWSNDGSGFQSHMSRRALHAHGGNDACTCRSMVRGSVPGAVIEVESRFDRTPLRRLMGHVARPLRR